MNKIPAREIEILHQCSNYLVINKPYDLRINSDDDEDVTVSSILARQCPQLVATTVRHKFRFCHRLDYSTSGVLCLALNKKAAATATKAFSDHRAFKHYIAIVRGHVIPGERTSDLEIDDDCEKYVRWEKDDVLGDVCTITVGVGNDASAADSCPGRMCSELSDECRVPKPAHTKLCVLERGTYENKAASKLLLLPQTGRAHQLRVHCKFIGQTIVGDYTYSNRQDNSPHRMMLHASKLCLKMQTETLSIQCPDPFTADTDPEWKPTELLHSYEQLLLSDAIT